MTVLTDAQLRAELERCQSCEAQPCRTGCPANLAPAEFIRAARAGGASGYRRAAAHILGLNPLGGTCGAVCPDDLCMARCTRASFDRPVNIPAIQAAIVARATRLGVLPRLAPVPSSGHRVAVVGAGPAGLGAASVLARAGHAVDVLDRARAAGGLARLVPGHRLDPAVLSGDIGWLLAQGGIRLLLGKRVALPRDLLARGYGAVVVAGGRGEPVGLDVPGAHRAVSWAEVLGPRPPRLRGRRVAVVGDGPVAVDCAGAALASGAAHVELFGLRTLSELELGRRERDRLLASGIHVSGRVRVTAIRGRGRSVSGLALRKVSLPAGQPFHPDRLLDLPFGAHERRDLDLVVLALGGRAGLRLEPHPRIVYAGDLEAGPTSVVEAVASGKRAALAVQRLLSGEDATCPDRVSCGDGSGCPRRATCPEKDRPVAGRAAEAGAGPPEALAVSLDTTFHGRPLRAPFLLAALPFTSGHTALRRAYAAGWPGAIVRAPEPLEDGAALERLCSALERLRDEFPGRCTAVALGEPPRDGGAAEARRARVARRLEDAGAIVLESDLPGGARGPLDAGEAAALLAAGAAAVPCSEIVLRRGLGVIDELRVGLADLLAEHGLGGVAELRGRELVRPGRPQPGAVPAVDVALCTGCGNCTRCPDGAVALDARGRPAVDATRCTGCGVCLGQCLPGAIALR